MSPCIRCGLAIDLCECPDGGDFRINRAALNPHQITDAERRELHRRGLGSESSGESIRAALLEIRTRKRCDGCRWWRRWWHGTESAEYKAGKLWQSIGECLLGSSGDNRLEHERRLEFELPRSLAEAAGAGYNVDGADLMTHESFGCVQWQQAAPGQLDPPKPVEQVPASRRRTIAWDVIDCIVRPGAHLRIDDRHYRVLRSRPLDPKPGDRCDLDLEDLGPLPLTDGELLHLPPAVIEARRRAVREWQDEHGPGEPSREELEADELEAELQADADLEAEADARDLLAPPTEPPE